MGNTANPQSHTSNPKKNVLVLLGPTASGKTPVSLLVARQLNAEIISADSRQIYKLMDIGTAKASDEERKNIKHYFIDELMPDAKFDAAAFGKRGRDIIDDMLRRKKTPLVVGGSGLYIRALIDGFFDGPPADDTVRGALEQRLKVEGGAALLEELRMVDPDAAGHMLPSQTHRIIRAHEVYQLTGIPISKLQKTRIDITFTPVLTGLQWDRAKLYRRINERVERMIAAGLLDEVKRLKTSGYSYRQHAMNTVGYKEMFEYLEGNIPYTRAVELIQQNSRRYAKRQLTWFRADERIRWFDVENEQDFENIAQNICRHYAESLR